MSDFWGNSNLGKSFLESTHERHERVMEAKRDAFAAYHSLSYKEKQAVDNMFKSNNNNK